MDSHFRILKSDKLNESKTLPFPTDAEAVEDKLNRLAYAGGESVRRELASRFEKTLSNPVQSAINYGQAYAAGSILGSLGRLPGSLKHLGVIAGAGLAAFSLKDELNPERLRAIGSTGQSIWDSKDNNEDKISSMQKNLAPLVLDGGSLLLGVLTGKQLRKRKQQENNNESEYLFERRMDGWVIEKLSPLDKFLRSLDGQKNITTRVYRQESHQNFQWPWSDKAKEQRLFGKLSEAAKWHGHDSLAVAEQRCQLSNYYRNKGQLKESQYQLDKADKISEGALSQLNYQHESYATEQLTKNHGHNIKEAEKHFKKADVLKNKAKWMGFDDCKKAAELSEKSIKHYKTGLALHPGERDLVLAHQEDARRGLQDTLTEAGWNYLRLGDLPKAYLSYKDALGLLGKDDIRKGQRELMLAEISHRMKFFDEAEELYRSYLTRHPIDCHGSDYRYTSSHRDALVGITNCLVQRGKLAEAKEVGVPLARLGVLNHECRGMSGSWSFNRPVNEFQNTVEEINRALHKTREIPLRTKTSDLPTSLVLSTEEKLDPAILQ